MKQEQLAIENKKQEEIRKEEELKRKKELAAKWAEEQKKIDLEMQKKKEQEAFERLPQWKKDKLLREKKRSSACMENESPKSEEKTSKEMKKDEDLMDNLPKWKRDKMLRDKQIAEEKAKQEEQKKRELEQIRQSIRKKIKNDIDEKEICNEEKMDTDETTISKNDDNYNVKEDIIMENENSWASTQESFFAICYYFNL